MVRQIYDLDEVVGSEGAPQEAKKAKEQTSNASANTEQSNGAKGEGPTLVNKTEDKSTSTSVAKSKIVLPKKVANLDYLAASSTVDLQSFLLAEKLYTSKQFLELDVNELVTRYMNFSKKNKGTTSVSAGSARIYINKFRRLLRDSIGLASEGDVATKLQDAKVYRIVSLGENKESQTPTHSAKSDTPAISKGETTKGSRSAENKEKRMSLDELPTTRTLRSRPTAEMPASSSRRTLRPRSTSGSVATSTPTPKPAKNSDEKKAKVKTEKAAESGRTLRSRAGTNTDFIDLETNLGKKRQQQNFKKKVDKDVSNEGSRKILRSGTRLEGANANSSELKSNPSKSKQDKAASKIATSQSRKGSDHNDKAQSTARNEEQSNETKDNGGTKKPQKSKSKKKSIGKKNMSVAKCVKLSASVIKKSRQYPESDCLFMELKDPGSLGMKIENTPTGGVIVSAIIPGLQAERESLKVGDIIALAEVGSSLEDFISENDEADEEGYSSWWDNDMSFQDFIYLAKSEVRPMIVFVRRKTEKKEFKPFTEERTQSKKRKSSEDGISKPSSSQMKRSRINRWLSTGNNKQTDLQHPSKSSESEKFSEEQTRDVKRPKLTAQELQRKLRMDIVRAFKLRMAANELERLVPPPLDTVASEGEEYDEMESDVSRREDANDSGKQVGNQTQSEVRSFVRTNMTEQIVQWREEAEKLYNHPDHKEWEDGLKRLLDFKMKFGHTVVPKSCEDKVLVDFVKESQKFYRPPLGGAAQPEGKTGSVPLETEILNAINFTWNVNRNRSWDDMFEELRTFKAVHGHVLVPTTRSPEYEYYNLSLWVRKQRRKYRAMQAHPPGQPRPLHMMTDEQAKKLTDIGMTWQSTSEKTWGDYYEELLQFREENGHAHVPQVYGPNKALGNWVHRMRKHMSRKRRGLDNNQKALSDERIKLLDDVGFVWIAKSAPKRQGVSALAKTGVTDKRLKSNLQPPQDEKLITTNARPSSRPTPFESNVGSPAVHNGVNESNQEPLKQDGDTNHDGDHELHRRKPNEFESKSLHIAPENNDEPALQQQAAPTTNTPTDTAASVPADSATSVRAYNGTLLQREAANPSIPTDSQNSFSSLAGISVPPEGVQTGLMSGTSNPLSDTLAPATLATLTSKTMQDMQSMPQMDAAAHIQALSQMANLLPPPHFAGHLPVASVGHQLPPKEVEDPAQSKPPEKKKRSKKGREKSHVGTENGQVSSLPGYSASQPMQDQQTYGHYPQDPVENSLRGESNFTPFAPPTQTAPPTQAAPPAQGAPPAQATRTSVQDMESLWLWGSTQLKSRYS